MAAAAGSVPGDDAIAIIGLSCRFPGAPGPEGFWRLLRDGGDAIGEVPAGRWPADAPGDPDAGPGTAARYGGFIDGIDRFDAGFFGISAPEAAAMDPQQRLMLELAWEALEDAAVVPEDVRGEKVEVFIGAIAEDYARLMYRHGMEAITRHAFTGLARGLIANRISYAFGFRGASLTVDTAQSSSLVAVHMACESLRSGEARLAIAGGVHLNILPDGAVSALKFGGLSPDGRCYTFDARANGFVRGEGGGAVILKPLSRAVADGDRVYSVILGSAVNNDGASDGLTVPSRLAQEEVLRLAYRRAGVSPADVQYVELHGTGTRAGDPIEAAALGSVIGHVRSPGSPLLVGSVKTNIGHLEGAAGIAGLIKVALAIWHREIPASLNFQAPNRDIPLAELNLRVQQGLGPWARPGPPGGPVLAGVSSFGIGGTNCHAVLAQPPGPVTGQRARAGRRDGHRAGAGPGVVPWVVSGRSVDGLAAQAGRLREFVAARPDLDPVDVGWSLAATRSVFEHRAVVTGTGREDLLAGLAAVAAGRRRPGWSPGQREMRPAARRGRTRPRPQRCRMCPRPRRCRMCPRPRRCMSGAGRWTGPRDWPGPGAGGSTCRCMPSSGSGTGWTPRRARPPGLWRASRRAWLSRPARSRKRRPPPGGLISGPGCGAGWLACRRRTGAGPCWSWSGSRRRPGWDMAAWTRWGRGGPSGIWGSTRYRRWSCGPAWARLPGWRCRTRCCSITPRPMRWPGT